MLGMLVALTQMPMTNNISDSDSAVAILQVVQCHALGATQFFASQLFQIAGLTSDLVFAFDL